MTPSDESKRIVIIGGGIHGVSIAYYLAVNGQPSTVIEQTRIAAAASGKAGGFLGRDWGSGPTCALHTLSYDLHKQLAQQLDIQSYRVLPTLEVSGKKRGSNVAPWLDRKVGSKLMDQNTAQVSPAELTDKLMAAAMAMGAEVIIDSACGIVVNESGAVGGVQLRRHGLLPADKVIVALGPWTGVALEDWLGLTVPMEGIRSTSLVLPALPSLLAADAAYACFCEEDANGCHVELYPRPSGDLYVCGCGGSDHVRGDRLRPGGDCQDADLITADPARVTAVLASISAMSSIADGRQGMLTQACMWPCTPDDLPVMGALPVSGAFVSAGHNCWGILWGPVCGKAMAELVMSGACNTVDLAPFSPDRFLRSSAL